MTLVPLTPPTPTPEYPTNSPSTNTTTASHQKSSIQTKNTLVLSPPKLVSPPKKYMLSTRKLRPRPSLKNNQPQILTLKIGVWPKTAKTTDLLGKRGSAKRLEACTHARNIRRIFLEIQIPKSTPLSLMKIHSNSNHQELRKPKLLNLSSWNPLNCDYPRGKMRVGSQGWSMKRKKARRTQQAGWRGRGSKLSKRWDSWQRWILTQTII